MPYIALEQRVALDAKIDALIGQLGQQEVYWEDGAVNYVITRLLIDYVKYNGLRYHTLQNVAGLLASVGSEFERRVTTPYERQKRIENGDVYPSELTGDGVEEGGSDGR